MRIAFNTLNQNPFQHTGSLDFYVQIIKEFARQDKQNEYFLLVSNANRHLFKISQDNVRFVNCYVSNERRLLRILLSQFVIPRRLAQLKIDILFSPHNISAVFIPKRTKSVISIITTHHWIRAKEIGIIRSTYRKVSSMIAKRQASVIVANSNACKSEIIDNLRMEPGKVKVVYEGLDHKRFHPGSPTGEEKQEMERLGVKTPYVLFVSQIYYYKNVHTLIDAFGKLCERGNRTHELVLVGEFDKAGKINERYVRSLIGISEKYGVKHRIRFVGYIPNDEVGLFYRSADLYVQPSYLETFGKTVTEAFACGVPVIGSDSSATKEVIGDAGLLFNPENPDELASLMDRVLRDKDLRSELVWKGLERSKKFSFEMQAKSLIKIFEDVFDFEKG